ncbi:beta-galactosidase [uncultured Streptococcus sp.]|uniref:aldose epimerase family protein n=1 Tax=uncultured Streptococcus sp. TaxID=83427 RepID=UPI0025FC2D84|nr:beta-galactosidase [uncultured Streptococcus sp.]
MARFKIGHSFCLDDREFKILSGAIHYFRVQPEDWYHSLYNLKALGFNTVETYLPWNMHEPQKGVFDFQGILDIEVFLQTAQDLGLYAIIRPSPFICAEWEFGGLPAWLLNENMRIRSSDEVFLQAVANYYDELLPRLTPRLLDNGGNILMMQVENEYGSYGEDKAYLFWTAGQSEIWVSYTLTEKGELEISYQIQTDQDTLVNPTNHSYFNLSGRFNQPIDDHILQLNTGGVYPIAADGLPEKKADAERDFVKKLTKGAALKEIFDAPDEQIQRVSGLDHPFALSPSRNQAGTLYHPASGRRLTIQTQASCLVIYSANCVDDSVQFDGQPMIQHNGLALEAQALPDAIHSSQQSDVILKAGQIFTSRTVYFADVPATL